MVHAACVFAETQAACRAGTCGKVSLERVSTAMNKQQFAALVLAIILPGQLGWAQTLTADVAYVPDGHERQVLDIYAPETIGDRRLPVFFWIHGGGWQVGDKSDVGLKPKVLTDRGFVFVSTNYRLLPEVEMGELIRDVARALAWVHENIDDYGGDPTRIFVGGHSAGAQLAALICIDDRYLREQGISFDVLKGCVPVDGDTYDIPKIIMTAEHRQTLYGGKMFTFGHRQKFGNDPEKHVDFSAVTHVIARQRDSALLDSVLLWKPRHTSSGAASGSGPQRSRTFRQGRR